MGNLCRSETRQYKSLIAGVYPKDENDDRVQEGNLRKLTMCCLYNTNLLPQIGNRLEKLIRNDLQRKKINRVIVGCKALDGMIAQCYADLPYFIINVESIVNTLIEHPDVRLKIQATETLYKVLAHIGDSQFRRMDSFVKRVVEMTLFNYPSDQQQQVKVRVAAMRLVAKMTTTLEQSFVFERLHEIIPPILSNLKDTITGNDHEEASETQTIDFDKKSLNDKDVVITSETVRRSAIDSLSAISSTANLGNIRNLMKPIADFLDKENAWNYNNLPKTIMKTIISSGWSTNGYYLVSFLVQHLDNVNDLEIKKHIFVIITFIISIQNKKGAVGATALDAVASLIRLLFKSDQLEESISDAIEAIAKRGQFSSQNINIITAILSDTKGNRTEKEVLSLLGIVLKVARHSSAVSYGRFYPEHLTKAILAECVAPSRSPRARELAFAICQEIIRGGASTDTRSSDATNIISTPDTSNTTTIAVLSKQQRDEVHNSLFKSAQLKDNEPGNFVQIYRTFGIMLKQYRNKDLETSIPVMFRLQAVGIPDDPKRSLCIQNLVAAYLLLLAKLTSSKDLEKYVISVIEQRIESKQVHPNFVQICGEVEDETTNTFSSTEEYYTKLRTLFEFCTLYNGPIVDSSNNESDISSNSFFNPTTVIDILCKIESVKQSYDNVRESLSTVYSGESVKQKPKQTKDFEEEQQWQKFLDEPQEILNQEENQDIATEDDDTDAKIAEVTKINFAELGGSSTHKIQQSQKAVSDVLNLIPQKHYDDDTDDDEQSEHEQTGGAPHSHNVTGDSAHSPSVPQLYLFDSPEFLQESISVV